MTDPTLLELFQRLGVVTHGHFVLSSGRHSDEYWEKFRLLEWPRVTQQLCERIAEYYRTAAIEAVVGPTTGGALLAQEVARQLDTRCLIAEPALINQGRELRRGFTLRANERVLIVDDVLTTGLSLRETLAAVERYAPNIVGIAVMIDRSGDNDAHQFGVPYHALLTISAASYAPQECPLCTQGIPIVKPGTRGALTG
ncbi:MAG: orotate phosphoribosyltransferase [Ktedonobacteraceae bacterium]|nr:orotate phosphoribosyltransferase [Ktedonobacteraceae bacterium]